MMRIRYVLYTGWRGGNGMMMMMMMRREPTRDVDHKTFRVSSDGMHLNL